MDEQQDQDTGTSPSDAPDNEGGGSVGRSALRRRSAPPDQHLDTDALSGFLDNRLEEPDRAFASSHLARCEACRGDLAELRATVALLSGLPQYRPSRSFQLGPEHAVRAQPSRFSRFLPLIPSLRVAAAVVALLLVGVTAADLRFADDTPPAAQQGIPAATSTAPSETTLAEGRQSSEDLPAADEAGSGAGAEEPASEQEDQALQAAPAAAPTAANSEPAADTSVAAPAEAEPAADRAPSPGSDRPSAWRLAQVGLALVLLWLLVALVGLQRLKQASGRRTEA